MNASYFSPGIECINAIVGTINSALFEIKICVFTISDDRIANAILQKQRQGVKVRIITDNDKCYDMGSDIGELCKAGINVRVDRSPYHMHHKFAIIDAKTLITGSYNWTRSAAAHNHENLIITDNKEFLKSFNTQFEKLWSEMMEY
jgi:mitochondrial cardiolipin hydrolase